MNESIQVLATSNPIKANILFFIIIVTIDYRLFLPKNKIKEPNALLFCLN